VIVRPGKELEIIRAQRIKTASQAAEAAAAQALAGDIREG